MAINLFAFDWSGTISDDRRPVYTANMRLLEHFGKPTMTFEEWLPQTKLSALDFMRAFDVSAEKEEIDIPYKKYLDQAIEAGIIPVVYPEAKEVLDFLSGKKRIAVLSSHPADNLRKEAFEFGLDGFIVTILGNAKDKAAGLKELMNDFGERPETSLYCGDTIYDIRAAKQANVFSVGVSHGYHIRERLESEKPDLLIDDLKGLKELADKI